MPRQRPTARRHRRARDMAGGVADAPPALLLLRRRAAGMNSGAIDAGGFREAQHRNWDAAAVGWMQWSAFNDRADRHISERLVELAGVRAGSRVLDVAAGYGEPALTAA